MKRSLDSGLLRFVIEVHVRVERMGVGVARSVDGVSVDADSSRLID